MLDNLIDSAFILSLWVGLIVSMLIYAAFLFMAFATVVLLITVPVYMLVRAWI